MIPSFCIPHLPVFVASEHVSEAFNSLFETNCVDKVQLVMKSKTQEDGTTIDYKLCFIHFKEGTDFNQAVLDACLAKFEDSVEPRSRFFKIFPDSRKPFFWKVFLNTQRKAVLG